MTATLTDTDGNVSNQVWQWESSPAQEVPTWASITGATSASYTPQAGDAGHLLRVRITYSDGSGTGREANSTATERVDNPGTVTLSPNPPVVGKPVRATVTDADGSIGNQTWKWERSPGVGDLDWTAIGGDHSDSYTPTSEEDAGKLLRVIVSYDDTIGIGRSATSSATERVDREGVVTVNPSPPVAGRPVTATLSDADGMVSSQVWKWERSPRMGTPVWTLIVDATASSYTPMASADGGMLLKATVSYDDKVGSGRVAVSATTQPVDQPGVVTLTTTEPVTGEALTATLIDGDGGILNAAWQWENSPDQETPSWSVITGAEAAMYTAPASLAGKLLRAVVNYDDTTGRGRWATSDTTAPLDQRGMLTLSPDAPIVGQAVTATLTDADGGLTNQTWVWESSPDQGDLDWAGIPGSDSSTYTPQAGDAGKVLRGRVTYDDAVGTGRLAVSVATAAVDQRGAVMLSPQIPLVGEAVTATLTDPDGPITNQAWKWERSPGTGTPEWGTISGAQSSSYTPTALEDAAKLLRVVVTYTDGTGSGRGATSAATNRVDQRGTITLSTGVPDVGIEVTASLSDDDGGVTGEMWRWQRSPSSGTPIWTDITGATTAAYTPVAADEGALLRVMVDYEDAVGSGRSSTSQATQKVGKPGTVSLDSTEPVVGEQLTAMLADADGGVSSQVWQWESSPPVGDRKWSTIADATSSSYTPQSGEAGKLLRVRVTYSDGSGAGREAGSQLTSHVDQAGTVTVTSRTPMVYMPEVGVWQDAKLVDPDGKIANANWEWEVSSHGPEAERVWTPIPNALSDSYKPVEDDAGKILRTTVVYDDGTGLGKRTVSPVTDRVDSPGTIQLSSYSDVAVGKEVTAMLNDLDEDITNEVWQWQRSTKQGTPAWDEIDGATFAAYTPTDADAAMILQATVLYDDAIGRDRMAVSASTGAVDRPGVVTLSTEAPEVGETIEALLADGDGFRNVVWRWDHTPVGEPNWHSVAGVQAPVYTVSSELAGGLLRAVSTYDDATARRVAAGTPSKPISRPGVVTLDSTQPVTSVTVTAALSDLDGGVTGEVWNWQWAPDQVPLFWHDILGANSRTYVPSAGDAGRVLRATVAYVDSIAGGRSAQSSETAPVDQPGEASLSSLEPRVGELVQASLVDPDGDVSDKRWSWERAADEDADWMVISGANTGSYTPVDDDVGYRLRALVIYEDVRAAGRTATSNPTSLVYYPGTVMLFPNMPVVGEHVTAKFSHPDGDSQDQTWTWDRSPGTGEMVWEPIPEADMATYTPVDVDAGWVLRATVSYEASNGSRRSASGESTARVDRRGTVTLTPRTPVVGEEVIASLSDPDVPDSGEVWRWERSSRTGAPEWRLIDEAQSSSYTPTAPADLGQVLRAIVTYSDGVGIGKRASSEPTQPVDQRGVVTLNTRVPDIGIPVGAELADGDGSVMGEVWQWQRSSSGGSPVWTDITHTDEVRYTPLEFDDGMLLRAKVTYSDGIESGRSATSAATQEVGKPGVVSLEYNRPLVGETLTAMLTDPDGGVADILWQWERSAVGGTSSWEVIGGVVSEFYAPLETDAGRRLRVLAVYTDTTGDGRNAVGTPTALVKRRTVAPVGGQIDAVASPLTKPSELAVAAKFNFLPDFAEGEEAVRQIAVGRPGAKAGIPIAAADLNGDVLSYLLTGKDSAFFEVDAINGQVHIARRLTGLLPGVYQVMVHAVDLKGGVASISLTITVLQLTVPVFREGHVALREVMENLPVGTAVGVPVKANDPDGDELRYSVDEGSDGTFEVHAITGQITTRQMFDAEIGSVYAITLGVEDGRGGRDSIQVEIKISDVNEAPVFDNLRPVVFTLPENLPAGVTVGQPLVAHDPEEDPLTYSVSGVGANTFDVLPQTGRMVAKKQLDYEGRSSYRLEVNVDDGRGGSDQVNVAIEVIDVNEPPVFRPRILTLHVLENLPAGAVVGAAPVAHDPEGDKLVYSLSGDGEHAFDIDSTSGLVTTERSFDFESRDAYLIQLYVSDGAGGADSVYLTVNVTDVDEAISEPAEEDGSDPVLEVPVGSAPQVEARPGLVGPTDVTPDDDPKAHAPESTTESSDDPGLIDETVLPKAGTQASVPETELSAIATDWRADEASDGGVKADSLRQMPVSEKIRSAAVPDATVKTLRSGAPIGRSPVPIPQQPPVWMVMVLLILPYVDGIVLLALSYQMWGRHR